MSVAEVVDISRDLLYSALLLALPALGTSLLIGLFISIVQTVMSIQDQTLSFVPRIVAVAFALVFSMSWMLQLATNFTLRMIWKMSEVTR
ncbi:MAG: flagellar biosynthesis protein FliQ [Gemmatales bacterium]|nr:MAG: flagellar biosynthesis protein FliQ [Gemmatales bacterium]